MAQETAQLGIAPHLVVDDGNAAIEFYKKAFGATEVGRVPVPDGKKLMHAHLEINGSPIFLMDDFPEFSDGKESTPKALGGTPVVIHLQLADVDSAWKRAIDAGATVQMELADQFWGDRYGQVTDPFGHLWSLGQQIAKPSPEEVQAAMREQFGSQ